MKPFVKWAGGKRQFLEEITKVVQSSKYDNSFIEPFVGGGAAFLKIEPKNLIINDLNNSLISSYIDIKNNVNLVIEELEELQNKYNSYLIDNEEYKKYLEYKKTKNPNHIKVRDELFFDKKSLYDSLVDNKLKMNSTASNFIFVNKTCFNGLFRVNSKGKFNVPFSYKRNINVFERESLLQINYYLNNNKVNITSNDYKEIISNSKKGDFIFCDPPYDGNTFTSYSKQGFEKNDQKELMELLNESTKRGVKWLMTNHPTELIMDIYSKKGNYFKLLDAYRFISSDASKRNKSVNKEVFITNFPMEGYEEL